MCYPHPPFSIYMLALVTLKSSSERCHSSLLTVPASSAVLTAARIIVHPVICLALSRRATVNSIGEVLLEQRGGCLYN